MGDMQDFKFEDTIPDLSPETQSNFRKFLQVSGFESILMNDGRRISDTEVLKAMRSNGEESCTLSLIPACINGDAETVKSLLSSGNYDVNEVAPDGETALTCAISANALHVVEVLLVHGADPNFRGKKVECTPLMEAASVGYADIVRLLLEYGACVGQKSSTGNTAMHYAATAGHLDCVRFLLQYNGPMEFQNETGHTPLMEATSNGHIDVARCLIKHGCDINTHSTEFKESALTLASYKGHTEMVQFLLDAGADHEHRTDEMHTALMEAAMEGHVEVARLLLAHGANVNIPLDSFESPLTLAACGGHTELALLLIGYEADIEEVNDEGYTPLMEAAREGHEETVALLLAVGADVNARTEETQETALTLAACGGFIEVCEMLLNAGADIEVGGVGCSTPLMEAAQEGHLDLVRRLLQRGAAVNAITATGDTALHYAAENGHVKVCKELLDWGAVFGAMTEGGRTPLMKAARSGNLEVVQLFLEHGVPIDQTTSQNDANALSLACSGGHAKVVKFLLQHGADPQYQLRDGSTMLIESARSGNPAVLRLILDYPRCLTQPSTAQILGNAISPQQLQLLQQQSYQPIVNAAVNATMQAPILPLLSGGTNAETCLDPSHLHLHAHQHSLSCRVQHAHQPLSFQSAIPGLISSASITQPPTHLDAALVSAYAVGWADGAASLAQQQTQIAPSGANELQASVVSTMLCSSNALLTQSAANFFDATAISQSLPLKSLVANAGTHQLRSIVGSVVSESHLGHLGAVPGVVTVNDSVCSRDVVPQCESTTATNSINSLSSGSSVSGGSSSSSVAAGASVDPTDDVGAGLLQALLQELMPDKDDLINQFKDMYAKSLPRNTRSVSEQKGLPGGAATVNANSPALSLSRFVDQQQLQQQCRQLSTAPETDIDLRSVQQRLAQCSHTFPADLLSLVTRGLPGDGSFAENLQATIAHAALNLRAVDQSEVLDSAPLDPSTTNTTPVLSSCHSSSSVLSTHDSSTSSSVEAADSTCHPSSMTATTLDHVSTLNTYEYDADKSAEILTSAINSRYFGTMGAPTLANTPSLFQEPAMDHDLLASYRHYHHSGPHMTRSIDVAAASIASTGHSSTHSDMHHHHHPLAVSAGGDGLAPSSGLLHVPHPSAALSVDALMTNPAGALTYDPASVLAAHSMHQSSLPTNNLRILPTCPTSILSPSCAQLTPAAHLLTPAEVACMNNLSNPSAIGESVTPANTPSLIDVNACIESSMETALTLACHGGYTELVRLLLDRGADREHRDKKSHTSLHTAVYANQRAVVALLLDYGAEIEAQVERTKDTALSIACSHGMLEIVEELLNRGANKEHRNISDYTPLSLAASGGHVEVIQLLLRNGAEINSRTGSKLGISPLMLASMNGHTNAVRLLLEHGSDINAHIETNRNTALTLACFQGRHAVVSLLVERKANIEHRAKTGLTPLMEAASGDYVEVGMILLDHGADVNASPVPSSRDTALTIAADKGNAKFVNLLLEKGAIVEARNKKGATPLWLASNGGHLEVVQNLIRYNADVNSQDNRKVSCLMAAFRKGHVNVVRLLVQNVTQFPSDKDCVRHIKTAVTDKELAKRCQQCREIIIAAKEKQEGEARKNANCLLEQIEQEEEERANREAMQARKRERKRMKRKAKQEKDRQDKEVSHSTILADDDEVNGHVSPLLSNILGDHDDFDTSSTERRIPVLSHAVEHVCKSSFDIDQSGDITKRLYHTDSVRSRPSPVTSLTSPEFTDSLKGSKNSLNSSINISFDCDILTHHESLLLPSPLVKSATSPTSSSVNRLYTENTVEVNNSVLATLPPESSASTTEAKREKHRNKKQSQRAAKRAAAEGVSFSDGNKLFVTCADTLPNLPVTSAYFTVATNSEGEVNWNALIESQSAQLGKFLTSSINTSGNETNTWTVVLPSNNSRTQRSTIHNRSVAETTDWKISSTPSNSFKRRISIPVSRHDIGKVIGQGGAVVSALRNMSGIQIDIESARSDEVTERMVYLKGSGDAVQRTYETIQGLLNGSIAGNDVLLMYAALKKSTTTASLAFNKSVLGALNSKSSGTTTLATSTNATKSIGSSSRTTAAKVNRRAPKASSGTSAVSTRSSSPHPPTSLLLLQRSSGFISKVNPIVATCANSNNNSTSLCSATSLPSAANGTSIMSTKVTTSNAFSWSPKVPAGTNSAKANFASVAAAGLVPHTPRIGKSPVEVVNSKVGFSGTKSSNVPNLMNAYPSGPLTTAPVSLLSLNVSPFSTNSQMFPDLSFSNVETAPDSMDDNSFPPLNSKTSRGPIIVHSSDENEAVILPQSEVSTTFVASNEDPVEPTGSSSVLHREAEQNVHDSNLCCNTNLLHDPDMVSGSATSAIFKPLSVSPPVITGSHSSQPATPVSSGGSHLTSAGTPPTTVTHVRNFARAPGSERSAHQRNANVSSIASGPHVGDNFPPSLMSLDVNAGPGINPDSLLTPTKRAASPEIHDLDFHRPTVSGRFRTEQPDWQETNTAATTSTQPCLSFSKISTFSVDMVPTSTSSIHPPVLCPISVSNKATIHSSDVVSSTNSWSASSTDLNPNAVAFEPSTYQPPGTSAHLASIGSIQCKTTDSSVSMAHSKYSELSQSDTLCGGYSLDSTLSSGIRQASTMGFLKSNVPCIPLPGQNPSGISVYNDPSLGMLTTHFSPNATITTVSRSKPLLSVAPNAYGEARNALLNGFGGSISPSQPVHASSLSTLVPAAQFHSVFPSGSQQSLNVGTGNLQNSLAQQQASSSRLGGSSSHPLLNQSPFGMACSTVSADSYTPPPCVPAYMQPGIPAPSVGTHPYVTYPAHLLNGAGSTVPVLSGGSLVNSNTAVHQPPSVQPASVQPIGAERRRQTAATLSSSIPAPPVTYSPSTSNGTVQGPYNFVPSSIPNHSSVLHPHAPSSQQSSAQNLLMLMNLVQQQQQLSLGGTNASHPTASWQSPPVWPSSTMSGNFSGAGSSAMPPSKLSAAGLSVLNSYNSPNVLPGGLSNANSSNSHQQLVAAMAAMGICPWNSNGPSGSSVVHPTPSSQNRWLYPPQGSSGYSGITPVPQNFFPDPLPPSLKPPLAVSHANPSHHPQAVHRPTHE